MSSAIEPLMKKLENLDNGNLVESAKYREEAQNILANPTIALKIRMAIADLLIQANQQLMLKTVVGDESY